MYRSILILAKLQTKPCESVIRLGAEATTFVVPQRLDDRARLTLPRM
jgi:hypothetical protein